MIDTTYAGVYILGVVHGIVLLALCLSWSRAGKTLDDLVKPEPEQPRTRPTSSTRKAGRGRR